MCTHWESPFLVRAMERKELATAYGERDSEVSSSVTRLSGETTDTIPWEVPRDSLLTRQALPVEKIILKWLHQQLGYPNECTHTFSWDVPRDSLLMRTARRYRLALEESCEVVGVK